ncbi:MAG: serine protease [Planctomycetia bacterium]|nr:serine protease [Planctomycetia bacterium]
MRKPIGCVLACCLLLAAGCQRQANLPAETWAASPVEQWPQLVLTNEAQFTGHTPLHGASAGLIKTRQGRTLAATARHLIGSAGGVEPWIAPTELKNVIQSWRMFPRTHADQFVEVDYAEAAESHQANLDWLILHFKQSDNSLPVTPLQLRQRRVEVDEKVYLIGCPYAEPGCVQNVYGGIVTARYQDRFRFSIERPVDLRGFSGAPIVDVNGHVVGVMTVGFKPKLKGSNLADGGGEDAASIFNEVDSLK